MEECQLKCLCKTPFYSVMADECTDIATIEELSLFFRCTEDGEPVEHFFDIVPLKKADAASIYTTLTDWLRQKSIQPSKLSEWDLMEQKHFLEPKMESRRDSKRILLKLFVFTVIATCFNFLAFKLPTILLKLNMYTRH